MSGANARRTSNFFPITGPPVWVTLLKVPLEMLHGSNYEISVSSGGEPPFTYQWKKDGMNIPDATGEVLIFESAQASDAGEYSVVVSNALGTVESPSAKLTVRAPIPGRIQWEFKTGNVVSSSPAIGADGTVYVGSDDTKVYALDGKIGAKQWQFQTGVDVYSSPAIGADGTVYVGSKDQKVYALDGKTGVKQWEFKTGGWVYFSPSIGADGTVYVGSYDNKVYALDGRGPRWNPTLNAVTVKQ